MKVSFVASLNGFGHTSRLLRLAEAFLEVGHRVTILAGAPQTKRILATFHSPQLAPLQVFPLPEPMGLEGPAWGLPGFQHPKTHSDKVSDFLHGEDLVLSDNSLWPSKFSDNFVLLGQFIWLDYWKKLNVVESSALKEEVVMARGISDWFGSTTFAMQSSFLGIDKPTDIGLPASHRERLANDFLESQEIWLSVGTTGLNLPTPESVEGIQRKILLVKRETFLAPRQNYRPAGVAGRPGLGTIRDCVELGIPFLPLWEGDDPELNHNQKVAEEMGIVPEFWTSGEWRDFNSRAFLNELRMAREPILSLRGDLLRDSRETRNILTQSI